MKPVVPALRSALAVSVGLFWCALAATAQDQSPVLINGHPAHPTRILAKLVPRVDGVVHAEVFSSSGMRTVKTFDLVPGLVLLEPAPGSASGAQMRSGDPLEMAHALAEQIEILRVSGLYEYVEPDYIVTAEVVPSDASFSDGTLWGLRNTGQSGGVSGVDIDAVRAWDVSTGSTNVVVAVIDSGVRYTHQDLAAQMWINSGEISGNGIDDDANGYIDDRYGINAITGSGDPMDDEGHGTFVAGIIGAKPNNGHPMVGVAWNVRLMAVKFLDSSGGGAVSDAIKAIDYAVAEGADILNLSWGGFGPSVALRQALVEAGNEGVLAVAAAGNSGWNTDDSPQYPSAYDLLNLVSVGAIDRAGALAVFSNYGIDSVDIAAPGVDMYSTTADSNSSYDTFDGTSAAAPMVSGVAALVRAKFPGISMADLRDRIVNAATPMAQLANVTASGGRLNAYNSLTATGTGKLRLTVLPGGNSRVISGRSTPITVRVSDLTGVTGATVTGTISTGGSLVFHDDGLGVDLAANDANYTAAWNVPNLDQTETILSINASAAGKTSANRDVTYFVFRAPSNDMFANRQAITANKALYMWGTNIGATAEPGEPDHAGESGGSSVWWTWTASDNGLVTIYTDGSTFDTLLAVYTGNAVSGLTEIVSNDNQTAFEKTSRVSFMALKGTTYQIALDGFSGEQGTFDLSLDSEISPANDNFADRQALAGVTAVASGTTVNATLESGESNHGGSQNSGSVWYSWTPGFSGTATAVFTENGGYLGVYTGLSLNGLVPVPRRNQSPYGYWPGDTVFAVDQATTYQIAVADQLLSDGYDFSVALSVVPGPLNDHFANRQAIVGTNAIASGNNTNATREAGEEALFPEGFGASLWWSWTAPADGTVVIDTGGSHVTPEVMVYTGSTLGTLTEVARTQYGLYNGGYRVAAFSATAGTDYKIRVDVLGYGGAGDITLHLEVFDPPTNDSFANRIILSGEDVSVATDTSGASLEPGEPSLGEDASGASVWYSWTPTFTGTAYVDLTAGGSQVAVYAGNSLGSLQRVFNSGDINRNSGVRFHADAGVPYQIAIDGLQGARGPGGLTILLVQGPSNDLFANRIPLDGNSVLLAGNASHATGETDEPDGGFSEGTHTVWWTWTAPENGTAILRSGENYPSIPVFVYRGSTLATLQKVPNAFPVPDYDLFGFQVRAGETFQIAVDPGNRGVNSDFVLDLDLFPPPANDLFANRAPLSGESVRVNANNIGALSEPNEPSHAVNPPAASLWWTWTAPISAEVVISTAGSKIETALAVYTGSSIGNLTLIKQDKGLFGDPGMSRVVIPVVAGTNYQIAVDGVRADLGNITLRIDAFPPPPQDMFANRSTLVGTALTVHASSYGATTEPGEPAPPFVFNGGASIWWRWVAPADGVVEVSTAGSNYYTSLVVYTGADFASLRYIAVNLLDLTNRGTTGSSRVEFRAIAGTEYQIMVNGDNKGMGKVQLNLFYVPPPVNDAFARRVSLDNESVTIVGNVLASTLEAGEPSYPPGSTKNFWGTAWWSWTAPASGVATVSVGGSHQLHAVYTGTTYTTLVPVPDSNNSPEVTVFSAEAGRTYQIAVGPNGYFGEFWLDIALESAPPNDMFADRIELVGTSAKLAGSSSRATAEPGEPPGIGAAQSSLWWTWTAPQNGRVFFQSENGQPGGSLKAFTGSAVNNLVPVPSFVGDRYPFASSFDAIAGTTYQIGYFSGSGSAGQFALTMVVVDAPTNDAFEARSSLAGLPASGVGSTFAATRETGEPNHDSQPPYASVWWTWTAPQNGLVSVETSNVDFHSSLAVYTGSSVDALTLIASDIAEQGSDGSSIVHFDAVAGTVYQIVVDGVRGAMGNYSLTMASATRPVNDLFANRATIPSQTTFISGNNRAARWELGELVDQSTDATSSIWWTWTAPQSGRLLLSANAAGFRPFLSVFTGSTLANLSLVGRSGGMFGTESKTGVAFNAVGGTTYQISVAGYYRKSGDVFLNLDFVQPPINDEFADRIVVSGSPGTETGSNVGAIGELWQSPVAWFNHTASIWWEWTPDQSGPYVLSTVGSSIPTSLTAFTGSDPDALTAAGPVVLGSNDTPRSRLVFNAVAGQTYQILVGGQNGAMGDIQLNIANATPPLNDNYADRITLSGSVAQASGSTVDATVENWEQPSSYFGHHPTSIWWEWTAPLTGILVATAHSDDFDPALWIYRGVLPSAPEGPWNNNGTNGIATLEPWVNAGETYYIAVGNTSGGMGDVDLQLKLSGELDIRVEAPSSSVVAGSPVTLRVSGSDSSRTLGYQWLRNGVEIPGATSATYQISNSQLPDVGSYSVRVFGPAVSYRTKTALLSVVPPSSTSAGRMTSLSTRALSLIGDQILIPGFVIQGPGTKKLLIRAVGPTLADPTIGFGITDALADPQMAVKKFINGAYHDIATNDDWGTNANVDDIIDVSDQLYAFDLVPGSADSVLLLDLSAGQYTVVTSGVDNQTGVAIVELYDADGNTATTKMTSIANRGFVGTGNSVMIPGIVIPPDGPKTLLIRVVGPTLARAPYNVSGVLEDPVMTVFRGNEAILTNDDWGSDPVMGDQTRTVAEQVYAFPLDEGSEDAAFVVTLNPGVYTVVASGANNTTGVALVEVYEVP